MEVHEFFDNAKNFVDTELTNTLVKRMINDGPRVLLYFIPFDSLNSQNIYPIEQIDKSNLLPICALNHVEKFQTYIISFGGSFQGKPACCTELKNNGIIEAADTSILGNDKIFPLVIFKQKISDSIKRYLDILIGKLQIETPIFFLIVINDVKGYEIKGNGFMYEENREYPFLIDNTNEIDFLLNTLFDRIKNDFY